MVTFAACSTLEASDNDPNQVGTVSVKFDRAAGACDISINYSGERYKQSIPVSSDPASSLNRLSMLVDKHPIDTTDGYFRAVLDTSNADSGQNKGKYFSYRLSGGCWHEASENEIHFYNQKIHIAEFEIVMPSIELAHDGESIWAGATPSQLVMNGFSVTQAPMFDNFNPLYTAINSANPDVVDESIRQLGSIQSMEMQRALKNESSINAVDNRLLQFDWFLTINGEPGNSREKFWNCFLQRIKLRDGTFTVAPATNSVAQQYNEGNPSLQRYTVDIDQWEFKGRIFGYSC